MNDTVKKLTAILCTAAMLLTSGCTAGEKEKTVIDSADLGLSIDEVSNTVYKTERNANPISPNIFCADPTAVEYEGRLYVYGTNDTQQAEQDTTNDYDQIKSLVVFSTDDMVNWVYHGRIETGEIAPRIQSSWAPSIVSRKEKDGKANVESVLAGMEQSEINKIEDRLKEIDKARNDMISLITSGSCDEDTFDAEFAKLYEEETQLSGKLLSLKAQCKISDDTQKRSIEHLQRSKTADFSWKPLTMC